MSTDDSPEREFDVYDSEGFPAAALEHEESISNLSKSEDIPNRSNPMENPKPSRLVVRCGGLIWERQITA